MDDNRDNINLSNDNSSNNDEVIPNVGNFTTLRILLNDVFEGFDDKFHNKNSLTGLTTGLRDLDSATGGLRQGDLIIVSGATSSGKSGLCYNIALSAAHSGKTIAFFSPTLNRTRLSSLFVARESHLNIRDMDSGYIFDSGWDRISTSVQRLWDDRIFFCDNCPVSLNTIESDCINPKYRTKIGLPVANPPF